MEYAKNLHFVRHNAVDHDIGPLRQYQLPRARRLSRSTGIRKLRQSMCRLADSLHDVFRSLWIINSYVSVDDTQRTCCAL